MSICVIAGRGNLPVEIFESAKQQGLDPKVIILNEFGEPENYPSDSIIGKVNITQIAPTFEILEQNNIKQVVFAGNVKRPSFYNLKPDMEAAKLLARIVKKKFLGDDNLLKIVIDFFEEKGFEILKPSDFIENKIINTNITPSDIDFENIEVAYDAFDKISQIDVGQAIIVSEKRIIAIEGIEGTAEMIKRSANYIDSSAILLKLPKPGQAQKIDMPTIGPETIKQIHMSGINGIAINKDVIISDAKNVKKWADELGVFIHYINK